MIIQPRQAATRNRKDVATVRASTRSDPAPDGPNSALAALASREYRRRGSAGRRSPPQHLDTASPDTLIVPYFRLRFAFIRSCRVVPYQRSKYAVIQQMPANIFPPCKTQIGRIPTCATRRRNQCSPSPIEFGRAT